MTFKEKLREIIGPTQGSEYEIVMTCNAITNLVLATLNSVPCTKKNKRIAGGITWQVQR